MVRNKRRSTALKMALAGMCTALCIEGMLQRGLVVPVYAEDTEDENYIDSQEWQDFKTYWVVETDKQINNFVATQSPELQAQYLTYILAGNMAIANMEYQENALAMRADPNTGAIDYSVNVPAGQISCGWYYRANEPHAITVFGYNQSGDWTQLNNNSVVLISSDEFTISVGLTLNTSVVYHGIKSRIRDTFWNEYFFQNATVSSLSASGFVTGGSFSSTFNQIITSCSQFGNSVVYLDNTSYTASQFVGRYNSYDYTYNESSIVAYFGCLKDSSGQPISNSRQQFIRAQVGNNFPDFLLDLKQQLDDNFPEEVVDELWYDPTQGEPLPDTGTLDSLTFPPGLPSVQFNDVELPSEPLPEQAIQGVGFWFSIFTDMLDALGVKYIVITFLVIALVLAILRI